MSLSAAVVSCKGDNDGSINISPDFLNVSLVSTNPKTISFESDKAWYVRVDYGDDTSDKWLDVSPMSGKSGVNDVVMQAVSTNNSGVERSAVVNILIPGSMGISVEVTQQSVVKSDNLVKLTRSMGGAALAGPSDITMEYDASDNVSAFTASGVRYELVKDGNKGTIKTKRGTVESSFDISLLTGYISAVGPLTWTFIDPNTSIVLKKSDVTIQFRYDSGENKRLRSVTRTELISIENAVELETPRKEEEVYTYTTEQLRFSKLEHILPYDANQKEALFPRDTLIYTFVYPTSDEGFQENNVTANVWDLVAFPDNQGTPFYSLTGYWILGLTGVPQSSFPTSANVEQRLHSEAALLKSWPYQYVYSFQRNANNFIEQSYTDIKFNGDTATLRGAMTFTYQTPQVE